MSASLQSSFETRRRTIQTAPPWRIPSRDDAITYRELETRSDRHPLVTEAAVTSAPDEENGVLIKAFLSISNGSRPSLIEMKRFCIEHLPAYMVPDRFVFPESLPKTSTDKIDYQRLLDIT